MPTRHPITFVGWVGFSEVAIAGSFLFPSLLMVNAIASGWTPILQFLAVMLGGAVQGFLVAFVQWAFLARARVTPPLLTWVGYSAAGTALAWGVGQVPSLLTPSSATNSNVAPTLSSSATTPLIVATIVAALAIPVIAQWLVLGRISSRAVNYAIVSFGAWLAGAAIMAGTIVVLATVTDLKSTIAVLVLGAFVSVFAVSVGTWFAAVKLTQPGTSAA